MSVLDDARAAYRRASGEAAYRQRTEAWQIYASVNATTDPTRAAWALGVGYAQHASMVLEVLGGGHAVWTEAGGCSWPPADRREGCADRFRHDGRVTRFLCWDDDRPLLVVRNALVDELLHSAPIPAELRAELEESAGLAGLGHTDAERLANSERAYAAGAAAWELARPAQTLLDLCGLPS